MYIIAVEKIGKESEGGEREREREEGRGRAREREEETETEQQVYLDRRGKGREEGRRGGADSPA